MAQTTLNYVIMYDVRDPKRWRKVYRLLRGRGTRLQYSVFRCRLTTREFEQLRWELERRMTAEDSLLLVGLCAGCVDRVVSRNRQESWDSDDGERFKIL